jgi:type I restriction enzyme S subunit
VSEGEGARALPPGWVWVKIEDLASDVPNAMAIGPFGSNLKVSDYRDDGVRLVFVRDIRSERFDRIGGKCVSEEKAAELSSHVVRGGDLLVTKMGDPPGDTAVFPASHPNGVITADCIKLTASSASSSHFLMYWLRAGAIRSRLAEQTQGVAQQKLSLERFRGLNVELPPVPEQRRIVAKLDELLTSSRRAREALDAVPALLDQYRKSLLAVAFWGEGPKGWNRIRLDTLVDLVTSGSRAWSKYYDRGAATFVLAGNVRDDGLDFTIRQLVDPPKDDPERRRTLIQKGDVLVTIVGANTGDCCCVQSDLKEHFVCQSVALVRPRDPSHGPWIARCIQASVRGGGSLAQAMYGAARPHLGLDDLRGFTMPMPEASEREHTSRVVDVTLANIERVRTYVAEQRAQLDALDRAILDKAFRGELVPQDTNDEPASVMLERLRVERAAVGTEKKPRGRRRAKDAEA